MEHKKQEYIGKVKMKLTQPIIKCSGRDSVTCHYRGKIISKKEDCLTIEFKFNNETVVGTYNGTTGNWESATVPIDLIWDIKLSEVKFISS